MTETFQNFDQTTTPQTAPPRVAKLRETLAEQSVAAFLVPRADAHQGENVAPGDERLAWISSFTGSAGFAIIAEDAACLIVDGRYTIQAPKEVDTDLFEILHHPTDKPGVWLSRTLNKGARIGYDPMLHSRKDIDDLAEAVAPAGLTLIPVANLIDRIWADRPAEPAAPVVAHGIEYTGQSHEDKRHEIAKGMRKAGISASVISLLDSIAWLLNIRGSDIAQMPVPRGFLVLHDTGHATLFTDPMRCDEDVRRHLGNEVTIAPRDDFEATLRALQGKVAVDKASAPIWISDILSQGSAEVHWSEDPCIAPKATKTQAELSGTRAAHIRDGVAFARFLFWFDSLDPTAPPSEIDVVRKLEAFRRETGRLQDISFETICGSGPNGAIVHYRVNEASNRHLQPGELVLVDSGGQYLDGTTDITRTLAFGPAPETARGPFTRVLQGVIAMSSLAWPAGLAGRDIDAVARAPLWREGRDYDHGTGHGVGVYLGVHEGPQSLSRRSHVPLEPGMIVSIEPGYYRKGEYGIRLENLAAIRPKDTSGPDGRDMLSFETLTLAPMDRRMIDVELLSADERDWLNSYHAWVLESLGPHLQDAPDVLAWLRDVCAPIA